MDANAAFVVVGVEPTDTVEHARKTYLARVRLLHPDRATDENKAEAAKAMAQLTAAWAIVQAQLTGHPAEGAAPRHEPDARALNDDECGLCGWSPASQFSARTTVGNGLRIRTSTNDDIACRECARCVIAEAQRRTFMRGWWGLWGVFAVLSTLRFNRAAKRTHRRRTGPPTNRDPRVVTALRSPAVYRSPWLRPSTYMPVGLLGVVAAVAIAASWDSGSAGQLPAIDQPVDRCINSGGAFVSCNDPTAAYKILGVTLSQQDCEGEGDTAFADNRTSPPLVYCASPLAGVTSGSS